MASLRDADWWAAGKPNIGAAGLEPSPRAAHGGQRGLRAFVGPGAAGSLEFSSAAIRVGQHRLICLRGWVRTPAALTGDGLLLRVSGDSSTLAMPIRYAPRWQPFEIYRATSSATEMRLLGSLSVPGEIWLDDLELVDLGPLPDSASDYDRLPVRAASRP
jgi:hypothetical protein